MDDKNKEAGGAGPAGPEMQRAEELVDQMSRTIRAYTSKVTLQILKGAARAREEAEDIWAEAQSKRKQP